MNLEVHEEAFSPLHMLPVSRRTRNAIARANIRSVEELIALGSDRLLGFKGWGVAVVQDLQRALLQWGFQLSATPPSTSTAPVERRRNRASAKPRPVETKIGSRL